MQQIDDEKEGEKTVRKMRRLLALLAIAMLLVSMGSAYAVEDGFSQTYTYNYDFWSDIRKSPDAYRVSDVISAVSLGLDKAFNRPQSLFVQGNDLYICDTYNNRIVQVRYENQEYKLVRVIDTIKGSDVNTFNTPNDVFVDTEGNLYVADTNNERVVMVDRNLNFVKQFIKPQDATFDQKASFLPSKLVVDVSGRVFCLATNVNKGLIKFENDTTFTGYIGANKAKYSFYDYIWKRFLSSKEQRAQQEAFVPTEYANLYMDEDGFIYATNTVFSEYDLRSDVAQPIRRLNGIGDDILIKNDKYPPIGDLVWEEQSNEYGPSKLVDITVLPDDIYVAIDRTRGRLFGYDSQGIMMWAFGTIGNFDGAFTSAISIEHMGYDLFVLDQSQANVTVFTPTEYGQLIYDDNADYVKGDYDGSAEKWNQVLQLNANYNMAFIGVGRALLRQEHYKEAMDYFEMAEDRENYGKAFRLYRKEMVEENIGWAMVVIVTVVVLALGNSARKKMKAEVEEHERNRVHK